MASTEHGQVRCGSHGTLGNSPDGVVRRAEHPILFSGDDGEKSLLDQFRADFD